MARNIPVTHLADYAADPEGHIQRRGRPRDPAAARSGRRAHAVFRTFQVRNAIAVVVVAAATAGLLLAPETTLAYARWLIEAVGTGVAGLVEQLG